MPTAPGPTVSSRHGRLPLAIGHARAISAQLRASRLTVFVLRRMGRLRLGQLLAIGMAGCLLQSAVHLLNSAQLQPNRPIFVLKNCLRLGWPTRLPIPRQDQSYRVAYTNLKLYL